MALARARRSETGFNYWPGFVDALSTLVLSIVFLLSVFLVVQFFLSQEVTGKDKALEQLNAKIAQLNDLLSLEKLGKLNLDDQLSQVRAGLASAETERDRVKGLYEGLAGAGNDAAGRASELNKALDSEKQVTSRALAQIEVLNEQISARRLGEARQGIAGTDRRSRPAPERRAGATGARAVALPFGILRAPARHPRQPAGYQDRRRPFCLSVRGVLRHGPGAAAARRPRRARQAGDRADRPRQTDSG
jgi:chemotaxis protein MotB